MVVAVNLMHSHAVKWTSTDIATANSGESHAPNRPTTEFEGLLGELKKTFLGMG